MTRIQIKIDMFGDKIVGPISDDDGGVGKVNSFRKDIRQLNFIFRIWRTRTQRRLGWIHHDARRTNIDILNRIRNSAPQQGKQSVIDPRKIDINRFDIAWSSRRRMQIPDREIGEDAALESKFNFQILLRRGMKGNLADEILQERPMQNQQQRAKNPERD
jgi:hypothetical protein